MMRSEGQQGFTLVELLVALFLFGILAAAGVMLLSFSVRAQGVAAQRLADVEQERRISAILVSDLLQAVPRVTRSPSGADEPAFSGTSGRVLLSYVRTGWSNSDGAPRAALQRVVWRLEGGALIRESRPMLDGVEPTTRSVIAEDISATRVRMRDLRGDWGDQVTTSDARAMPRAIELTITPENGPEIRRLFVVGTGYR